MIWITSKVNSDHKINDSVESSGKSAKIVHQIQGFVREFWQFSLYYGEFIATYANSTTSSRDRKK